METIDKLIKSTGLDNRRVANVNFLRLRKLIHVSLFVLQVLLINF